MTHKGQKYETWNEKYARMLRQFDNKYQITPQTPLSKIEFDDYGLSKRHLRCGCRRAKDYDTFPFNFPSQFRPIKNPHSSLICDNNRCQNTALLHQRIQGQQKMKKICVKCGGPEIWLTCDVEAQRQILRLQAQAHGLPVKELFAPNL